MLNEVIEWAMQDHYSDKLDRMADRTEKFERILHKALGTTQQFSRQLAMAGAQGRGFGSVPGLGGHSGFSGPGLSGMPGLPDFSGAVGNIDSVVPGLKEIVSVVKGFALAMGAAGVATAAFGLYSMKTAGEIEALQSALVAILGDSQKAEIQFKRLEEIARNPGIGYVEAIKSFLGMYGAGADQRMSERIISEFGNLNALNGGGKDQLSNVLMAVQQMLSKEKISAEEINQQLAEHLPQIRGLMKQAFGTSNIEEIADKITPKEFVSKMVEVMEKLPRAVDGTKNAFDNLEGGALRVIKNIGSALNKELIPEFNIVSNFLNFVADQHYFDNILGKASKGFKAGYEAMSKTDNLVNPKNNAADYADEQKKNGDSGFTQIVKFMEESKSLGDAIVRGGFLFLSAVNYLPDIMALFGGYIGLLKMGFDSAFEKFKQMIQDMMDFFETGFTITDPTGRIPLVNIKSAAPGKLNAGDPELEKRWQNEADRLNGEAQDVAGAMSIWARDEYNKYLKSNPSSDVANDKSKGGFRDLDAQRRIADNTKRTNEILNRNNQMMQTILGGGAVTQQALSRSNLSKLETGAVSRTERAMKQLLKAIRDEIDGGLRSATQSNPLRL